ncbi:hypothetical protein CR513_08491, partial [Mucuna pruriens]
MGTKQQPGIKLGYPIQIKAPNVQTLRYLGSCLKGQCCRAFEKMHGNLLQILEIDTQSKALKVLIQYYDPPTRCFTFRDFQLAPTLEEYERLLGLPLVESAQYFHQDQPPSWAVIAGLLKVSKAEMTRSKRNQNGLERLPRAYLEEEWPAVMDALGLLVYEILLFPRMEDHVDLVAVFPYGYPSQHLLHPQPLCCTPLLYLWLTAHLFHCKHRTSCPIKDFKWSWIQPMTKEAWVRRLNEASERTIHWYPPWNEREHMIFKCEGYPNVPLLGTQGAINYNLELVERQAGYPMIRPPPEEVMASFGATGRLRSCGASLGYRRWLEDRVKSVRLPLGRIPPQDSNTQKYEVQETFEIGKLKAILEQVKAKRTDLKQKLETAMEEVRCEKQLNVETTKRARVERETRLKVGSCLKATDKKMCARRVEREQVAIEKEQLEKTLLGIKIREEEQREQFRQLQEKMRLLEEELARANLSKECLVD